MSYSNATTLKQRALRAGGWSLAGHGLGQAIRLASSLIMTRLLIPEMFGVMAIATMVNVLLWMLSDIGLRQNIVQSRRGDDPAFLDTAWVVQIIRGGALWLMAIMLSVALHVTNLAGMLPAKSVYASPVLPLVIAVSSFSAVIVSFQSTKMATADRTFAQKQITQIELISQLVALVVMIVIGAATRSIWALVAGGLVGSLVTTMLSHIWLRGHPNRFRLEKNALRELLHFGKWLFVSSTAGVLAAAGDRLLLGGFVEADVLGLYAIAALIVRSLESGFDRLFTTVSLPVFGEIARRDPSRLREVYYRLRVPGDLLSLFLAALLFSGGQLLIDLLYDPRYLRAGAILQVLALSLFTARYGITAQVYLALGMPHYLTVISLVRCVSLYALVPALYYFGGTEAAIWGIALHALAIVPFIYHFNARLGLIDVFPELMVLVALPVGFLCGAALRFFWE